MITTIIKHDFNADLAEFKRRLRLKHYFHENTEADDSSADATDTDRDTDKVTKKYKKTNNWTPPVSVSIILHSILIQFYITTILLNTSNN